MNTTTDAPAEQTNPATDIAPIPATALPQRVCQNCGSILLGEHCYHCGQPVKGMIRPLSSLMHDVADTILNIDSRLFRTLKPLYFQPGYLTNEYFAGRRVRYVTPFRLYFFLSVVAFFAIQLLLSNLEMNHVFVEDDAEKISAAQTADEVVKLRDSAIAETTAAKATPYLPDAALKKMDAAIKAARQKAEARMEYLRRVEEARAAGTPPPIDTAAEQDKISFNDKPWDAKTNPLRVGWLPMFVNDRLNTAVGRAKDNLARIKTDPKPFLLGGLGMLPQVLFVLMPLFALLLKIFYFFKRRLYMEHLAVALHSHAFIFLSLLLLTLTGLARGWAESSAPWLAPVLRWAMIAMGCWLPIYLFLMQKKVYRQGWFFTTIKFVAIGFFYVVMVGYGVAAAFLVSLATT
jgi:Protein of unknown function (DUF3667)